MGKRMKEEPVLKRVGFDEKNFASIALIPVLERLPKDEKVLERDVTDLNGQPMKVTMEAGLHGMPTGLAGDVLIALVNLYIEAGYPEDHTITVTAYSLLKYAGMDTSQRYYKRLDLILSQFQSTQFKVSRWYEITSRRYIKQTFSIINASKVTYSEEGIDNKSMLEIRLGDEITRSIREGHVKQLDMDVYYNLPSVGARSLYRLLDAYLLESQEYTENKTFVLQMNMMLWASNCGIIDARSDNVKKILGGMNASLIEMKYLLDVTFVGRGKQTVVQYQYNNRIPDVLHEYVQLLVDHGVKYSQALAFFERLGDHIPVIVDEFMASKKKRRIINSGGYLATMLRNKAAELEYASAGPAEAPAPVNMRLIQSEVPLFPDGRGEQIAAATGDEAVNLIFPSFKVMNLKSRGFTLVEIEHLQHLVRERLVSNERMDSLVGRAFVPGVTSEIAVADLRSLLGR